MYNKNIYYLPFLLLMLPSCFVAKDYQQPEEIVDEAYFRTDQLAADSLSMAEYSWRDIFTDPQLVSHIETGLENNIDVRIALQQILAAQAYFKQGKLGQLPSVTGNAQVTHQELSRNSQFGSFFNGGITQYEVSAGLSWEADIWGKIRSQKRAFEARYLQSVAAHQAVKTRLINDIAVLYFRLQALDEQLQVTNSTISNREQALETTKALKVSGAVTEVGVKQTEAQLHTARALSVDITRDIKLSENTLSLLLGLDPGDIDRSKWTEQGFQGERISTGYPIQLLRNRPDVLAAEWNLVNAFELSNVARSNLYPSFSLSATGGLQSLELDQLFSLNSVFANIIAGLSQPIFNGRALKTQYEVALSQEEQAYLNFRQTLLNAEKEVSDAMYSYEASRKKQEIIQQELDAYVLAIEFSEELLDNGIGNYLEVITARENALNSEIGLINAKNARMEALANLYRALGGGWL
ncbi:efflux transporter, outer membrane factor (OMF) lipoprotein, NodT family [Cyclobacterium lianum]|uniref:Efflux transporter, outer membrane factor (OMF) lipoprotein, NodT family n=1 Tax=Cyclobacterium lianum TaxID=388280 RepID=A0A1M7LZK7_9BACT|nr:efflux transporter outer membrane subunit [Cyclobacterium lianum]SHM83798.1 efflux transporter, outer membrane factor (OMF) lipoprotein, NodT family [Cyclobacterium lianum]